jgi:hypothetical protein
MIGFIAFGALVALGMVHAKRKRREAEAREIVAAHKARQARAEADKALAELELHKLANPPRRPGRPRKAPEGNAE